MLNSMSFLMLFLRFSRHAAKSHPKHRLDMPRGANMRLRRPMTRPICAQERPRGFTACPRRAHDVPKTQPRHQKDVHKTHQDYERSALDNPRGPDTLRRSILAPIFNNMASIFLLFLMFGFTAEEVHSYSMEAVGFRLEVRGFSYDVYGFSLEGEGKARRSENRVKVAV